MSESIQNKKEMYSLYHRGRFGNKPISLEKYEEAHLYPHITRWTIRGMQSGGSYIRFGVSTSDLGAAIEGARRACGDNFAIADALRTEDIVFQGELAVDPFSRCPAPYLVWTRRKTLLKYLHTSNPRIATGLKAKALIRQYSDCSEKLLELPYEFGSETEATVVEFTVFSHRLGELNSNTVVWEVRNGY